MVCFANGKDDWQSRSHPELPQLKLKKIGRHSRQRKSSRKVNNGEKTQTRSAKKFKTKIEKIGRQSRIRKSPRLVKNGKVRRVKISLTETKQGSALKTFPGRKKNREVMRLLQKLFPISLLLFRLARHQLRSLKNLG